MWFYRVGLIEKKELLYEHSRSTVIAHRLWAHIGSIPWATSKSTSLPANVVARASKTARNLLLLGRAESPFYHRRAQSDVFGFENGSATTKSVNLGRNRLPPCDRHQPLTPRPTLLSCARAAAMCSVELVCCSPPTWGYDALCLELCSKTKKQEV